MNIAELFVNLGIKGSEKTVGALGAVKKGLGEVGSMSLEAKAGILAALYGFERLMSMSGQAGTGLTNFSSLTGLSAKQLQQWEYAARQAGVSADELTGNVKSVQNSMTNMLLGKGAPEGLNVIQATVGLDMKKVRDPLYVMQQLQKAAQALPPDAGNMILKSFGLSEGVIAAMRRNMFTPKAFAQAPTYSDREVGQLDKANIAWSNLGNKIQMAMGHFNASHGLSIVKDISQLTDQVLKLVASFEALAEKLKLFQVVGKVFEGWGLIFKGISGGVDALTGGAKNTSMTDKKGNLKIDPVSMLSNWIGKRIDQHFDIAPRMPQLASGGARNNGEVHITQNIVHHGNAKDTQAVKDSHKVAVNQAYRQRPAQRQGP